MKREELENTLIDYLARFPAERDDQQPLIQQIAEDDDIFNRKNMRGHIVSSALVLNAALDSVLFINHKALKSWLQPGGHYEAPGDLWESACREVLEETTVSGIVRHAWHKANPVPFDVHTHSIPARPAKNEGPHQHHDFLYLAIAPANAPLKPQVEEVDGVRWVPLAELSTLPGKRLAQRFLPKLKSANLI